MTRTILSLIAFLQICFQVNLHAQKKTDNKKSDQVLRIMSYNIHHGNPPSKPGVIDLDAISKVIRDSKADIVLLQEVERDVNRSGKVDQAKVLGEKVGLHYHFFKAIDHDGGDYGIAMLSRYKFEDIKLVPLPQKITAENRVLGYATIKIGKQKVIIANTHLDATNVHDNRIVQIERILKEFEKASLPVIVGGDLNSVAGTEVIDLLDKQFKRTCTGDCPGTIPEVNPKRTIDFIATKSLKWQVLKHEVIDESYASDHRPVMATFNIGK